MMDVDIDSEEDEEQLNDLRTLTAVLEADQEGTQNYTCSSASIASTSKEQTAITSTATTNSISTNTNKLSRIESALALNRLYDEKLKRLEKVLSARLLECRNKIKEIQGLGPVAEKHESFRYLNCGKPYFRDRANFPAPDNDDTLLVKSQMYDFSQVLSVPGWTVRDKSQFVSMIHKMSRDIRKKELQSKIAALRRGNSKSAKMEIDALEKEITLIKDKPLNELALPLDQEYDWEILANKLNRRHTAQEYQALWRLFFHPTINKNSWFKTEHAALQSIASEHNQQDWDTIAKELNTGRTGYQCFVYYKTNMINVSCGQKWTNEEVSYLRRLIDYFKQDNYIPWGKIAAAMGNRNKIQIYNKYLRLFEQRKGRFLPEEDAVILNCIDRFGENFQKMTDYLPGRSKSQLRARYNVIKNIRISTVWTVDDDRKLIQIMSNQDSDTIFSNATKHFPGKTRMNIRSRYVTLMKWMRRHPHIDIKYAPRRGARLLNHGEPSENLNKAIEDLKNTLKTVSEIRTVKKKITIASSENEIDDAIIATIINERIKEEESRKNMYDDSEMSTDFNKIVLPSQLNATNLSKCLVMLESRLNKRKFEDSDYKKLYPEFGVTEKEVCLVRVNTYSRKEKVTTIRVNGPPDVWGNITLSRRRYVLPPQYATITACRALLAYITTMGAQLPNLQMMLKKNPLFKQEFDNLLERFYILFLWPMLLSNEGPIKPKILQRSNKVSKAAIPATQSSSALANLVRINKKFVIESDGNCIDLKETDDKDDITLEHNIIDM